MRQVRRRLGVAGVVMGTAVALNGVAGAQGVEPVQFVVRLPAPQTHYLEVEARVPTDGREDLELMMAVWTPGSYLVREYARQVENVEARNESGRWLPVEKTTKNRWRVSAGAAGAVTVTYRVYAREMSVRTNWVDDRFALINGAPTFLTPVGSPPRPHDVQLVLPAGWTRSITGLPPAPDGRPHHYRAADYDVLVDSPIVAGNPEVHEFEVDGTPHVLVNVGGDGLWDGTRAAGDLTRIVRAAARLWDGLPYDRYVFLNLITEGSGGLEHRNSTVLMTSRWAMASEASYRAWLGLAAHEHFHVWNIKGLRPAGLGPFDYERENYTESLWVAEGITDYYRDLQLLRAGLASPSDALRSLSAHITAVESTPGRRVQSVEQASFDAWIKYYRPDENTSNTSISYYTKGAVIAFLLDARLREATAGARRLDDVMRLAHARYAGSVGFTPQQFVEMVDEVAGTPRVGAWLVSAVGSTEDLDYRPVLDWFGLAFRDEPSNGARAWMGISTDVRAGRTVVTRVVRDSPASAAGLDVDDEIIALDDFRVGPDPLASRMARYRAGQTVSVLVARRGALRTFAVELGPAPRTRWTLEVSASATREQTEHFQQW